MRWKLTIASGFLLSLSFTVLAQTQPSPSDSAPSGEEVIKFLEVTKARDRVVQMMEGMSKQARLGAELAFKTKLPDASPEQLTRVDALVDSMFSEFSPDEMIDAIVPIYQRHLSKPDLDAILVFYSSPAGQKILKETPAIVAESMEAGGEIGRKKIGVINQKIEEQIADMVREEQNKREKDQKRQPAKD